MNILFLPLIGLLSVQAASSFKEIQQVRKNCRQGIIERSLEGRLKSGIKENDRAESLIESPSKLIRNIKTIEEKRLTSAKLEVAPWSDSYWPLYLGAIGNRYNDPQFIFNEWQNAFDYIKKNSASKLVKRKQFDYLSPSEKYDYLFNILGSGLTQSNWDEGSYYYKESGSVETWMGLCHGWAAASIMMPEPIKTIQIQTTDGQLSFYPSDIKALATLIWAKGQFNTRFVGGRCNKKDPETDNMGRPKDEECLDNNPGTWHMAIINQIGQFKRSFVMDATYDYEVWNQPVSGYSMKYYNPVTKKEGSSLTEALVSKQEFLNDSRAKVRATKTEHFVGIKMTVKYVVETSPSTEEYQSTAYNTVQYIYDLELDKNFNIIGGEWYSDNHPDFLWVPDKNSFPETYGDQQHKSVDLNSIGNEVSEYAKVNAKYEIPFGPIVKALVNQSQQK